MADEKTVESLETELEAARARLAATNAESKGHRLNWQNAKAEIDAARAEAAAAAEKLTAAQTEAAAKIAGIEKAAGEKATAAERAAEAAKEAAQKRAVNADLRIAATDAGARIVAEVLSLLPRDKMKLNADGDVENAAELIAEFKAARPHLFVQESSNTTTPPPPKSNTGKRAMDMTDEEFEAAKRSGAWRK